MLTYVQGYLPTKHQSAHVLRNYKDMGDPSLRSQLSLVLMGLVAYHIKCIRRWAGGGWHLVTYVPSRRTSHPLAAFAELMGALIRADRIELVPGPSFGGGRIILPDTFVVPPGVDVSGKRVLILEDTWVSGSKVQSAAMAVKLAGATHVTTLCIGRWLSAKLPAHADFIETRLTPGDTYDAAVCPVFPTHMCGSGTAA
ncbi:phosphoribosyltransferase [Nocardia testacea]|uniref:Phosphoribosyltransferase n=1 Tax=Nocardia testacea TaxID=248551 RepID=A0ABW7VZW1_9NOCA